MVIDLWEIINAPQKTRHNEGSTPTEKINAFAKMFDSYDKLIDRKMDAGIFERKLGELKLKSDLTPEQSKLLSKALDYATNRKRKADDNGGQDTSEGTGN